MATTANLIQWLAAGVKTTAGVVVASGNVRFYQPGTLTPQNVYSDDAAASTITQPKVLSAGGTATVYTVNAVRMIIKDSLDVSTLWDVTLNVGRDDLIYVTSPAFNGGTETRLDTILDAVSTSFGGTAGYWKYKESSSATERLMKDWLGDLYVSVKDFGALGDDANDDNAAIALAINRVSSAAKGTVFFPSGTYRSSAAIAVPVNVSLKGLGRNKSIIKNTSTTANALTLTTLNNGTIEDIGISALTSSTGKGVLFGSSSVNMNRVDISGHRYGVLGGDPTTPVNTIINDCNITAPNADAAAVGISVYGSFTITGCRINGGSTGTAIDITSAGQSCIVGNRISGGATGISITNALIDSLAIIGNDVRSTSVGISISAGVGGGIFQHSNSFITPTTFISDARVASPVAFILAGTNSVTPLPGKSQITKIVQGGAAATTTINAPTGAFDFGFKHTVVCSNTSGGALTWTWNAAFKISAAVAPATGNRISVVFYYDPVDATWSEVSRSAAVPN